MPGDYNNNGIPDQYEPKSNSGSRGTGNSIKISKKVLRNQLKKSIKKTTKIKSLYSSDMAVDIILSYDDIIDEVSSQLKIQKEMIQAILYRELIC